MKEFALSSAFSASCSAPTASEKHFRSMHSITCFGGGCAPLGQSAQGSNLPNFTPKNIFNGPTE